MEKPAKENEARCLEKRSKETYEGKDDKVKDWRSRNLDTLEVTTVNLMKRGLLRYRVSRVVLQPMERHP